MSENYVKHSQDEIDELRDDSAKKLEEDVIGRATLSYYGDGTIRLDSSYMDRASLADVFDWLDRKAAITERENDCEEDRTGAREVGMTNYEKLFGTPERAARTLVGIVTADGCVDCALLDATCCRNKDAWLEWLKEDN